MVEESKTNWPPVGVLHAFDHDPGGPVDMDISPPGTRPPSPSTVRVPCITCGSSCVFELDDGMSQAYLVDLYGGNIPHTPLSQHLHHAYHSTHFSQIGGFVVPQQEAN